MVEKDHLAYILSHEENNACMHAKGLQPRRTLCDPMDCSPPGFSVHGILQVRYWIELPHPPPEDLPNPGIERLSPASPCTAGRFFSIEPPEKPFSHLKRYGNRKQQPGFTLCCRN